MSDPANILLRLKQARSAAWHQRKKTSASEHISRKFYFMKLMRLPALNRRQLFRFSGGREIRFQSWPNRSFLAWSLLRARKPAGGRTEKKSDHPPTESGIGGF